MNHPIMDKTSSICSSLSCLPVLYRLGYANTFFPISLAANSGLRNDYGQWDSSEHPRTLWKISLFQLKNQMPGLYSYHFILILKMNVLPAAWSDHVINKGKAKEIWFWLSWHRTNLNIQPLLNFLGGGYCNYIFKLLLVIFSIPYC